MGGSRAVCLICRGLAAAKPRLLVRRRPPPPPWFASDVRFESAAAASAEHATPRPAAAGNDPPAMAPPPRRKPPPPQRKPPPPPPKNGEGEGEGEGDSAAAAVAADAAAAAAPAAVTRKPRGPSSSPSRSSGRGSTSIALFDSVVRAQDSGRDAPPILKSPLDLGTYNALARFKAAMGEPDTPIEDGYALFKSTVFPALAKARYVPEIFRRDIVRLVGAVFSARTRDWTSTKLPPLSELTLVCAHLDLNRNTRVVPWSAAVESLVLHVSRVLSLDAHATIQSFEAGVVAAKTRLLFDLIESWRIFSMPHTLLAELAPADSSADDLGRSFGEFRLGSLETDWAKKRSRLAALERGVSAILSDCSTSAATKHLAPLVATFVLLSDHSITTPEVRAAASPLMIPLTRIFAAAPFADILPELDASPELARFLRDRWPGVQHSIADTFKPEASGGVAIKKLRPGQAAIPKGPELFARINSALANNNVRELELAWADTVGPEQPPDAARRVFLCNTPGLLRSFVMAFAALRMPDRAVDVWDFMDSIDLPPSIRNYTAMMDGFKRARDLPAMLEVWQKLVGSDLKLDQAAYTALISGLITCGKPDQALRALDTMAKQYDADPTSRVSVKPSIEAVNAALSGLLRLGGMPSARKLLEWAARRNLSPDVSTYNILLRTLVRDGDADIGQVLSMMVQQKIQPDDSTITVLVEGVGPYLATLEPGEQLAMVKSILPLMPKAGGAKNQRPYSKLVYVLLNDCGTGDMSAPVNAVLAHLSQLSNLTAGIYTVLAEHYLSRSPPQIDAVYGMIRNHRLTDESGARLVDKFFWERVLRGLLAVSPHDPEPIFGLVSHLRSPSTTVPLSVLQRLLSVLWDADCRPSAAKLVKLIKADHEALVASAEQTKFPSWETTAAEGEGEAAARKKSSARDEHFWAHDFWLDASELGLYQPPNQPLDVT